MFRSKTLKDSPARSKLYMWWIDTEISYYYYSFVHKFIQNPIFQIKKTYDWYMNALRFDYDFDSHGLFGIIEYKLKRLEKQLVHGNAWQDPKDLKALKLAIKLADRLREDKYEEVGYGRIDREWGEIGDDIFEPRNDSTSKTWHTYRSKVKSKEDEAQMLAYSAEQCRLSDIRTARDEKNLYSILQKHSRVWWD